MATTLETVAKTDFGSIAGNTGMYTGANVDSLLADLISKYDAKLSSAMHYKGSKADLAAIQAVTSPEVGDVYNATDTGKNYAWDGTGWDELSGVMDLSAYKTDADNEKKYLQLKTAGTAASAGALATKDTVAYGDLDTASGGLKDKVDAGVAAKSAVDSILDGTSLDSFSDVETALGGKQASLDSDQLAAVNSGITADLVTKLNGIETGAEANVQSDWNQTNSSADDYIKNKPTLGDLAAKDTVAYADLDSTANDLKDKVDAGVAAKGLVDDIAAVTAPSAMPTKNTVTLYGLYDAVDNLRTAVCAIITAAA